MTQQWADQTKREVLFMAAWPWIVLCHEIIDIRCKQMEMEMESKIMKHINQHEKKTDKDKLWCWLDKASSESFKLFYKLNVWRVCRSYSRKIGPLQGSSGWRIAATEASKQTTRIKKHQHKTLYSYVSITLFLCEFRSVTSETSDGNDLCEKGLMRRMGDGNKLEINNGINSLMRIKKVM